MPVYFNWFGYYHITIIVIHDHDIKVSTACFSGKAPVRSLKHFLLVLSGTIVTHTLCVFTLSMIG